MSAQSEFCMPLLVRQCLREEVTGTLTVSAALDSAEKLLFLEKGAVVFATGRNGSDLFGERLVQWGRISRAQLEEGLERRKQTGEKIGRALVSLSYLTPGDVRASVQRLITERVAEIFDWTKGSVLFDDNLPHQGEPSIATTPQMLLLRGVQNVSDSARVQRWLGDLDQLFVPIPEPFKYFDMLSLRPEEAFIISRLDQPVTPHDLLSLGSFDEQLVLRVVCALRFAGVLEPSPTQTQKVFWLGDGVTFDQLVTRAAGGDKNISDTRASTPERSMPSINPAEAAHICFLVEEKLRGIADGADHYALLEVERRVPSDRLKSVYREFAKTFHPDRHAQLAGYDANIKERLSAVFDAITQAYTTLSNPTDRAAYDAELQKRDQRNAIKTPTPSSGPALRPPGPPRMPNVPRVTPIVQPLSKTSVPVPPSRPTPPPSKPPPVTRPVVSEARTSTPPTPPPPDRARPSVPGTRVPPSSTPSVDISANFAPVPTLADFIARGEVFAESGDHNQAVRAFRKAVELAPDSASTHAMLGRSLSRLKGFSREAEKAWKVAIELEPENAGYLLGLAQLYKSFGRRRDARELALQALTLDPESVEAQDLVGALPDPEANARPEKLNEDSNILRRLFKRETK